MAYLKIGNKRYPFRYRFLNRAAQYLQAVDELENEGELKRGIGFEVLFNRLKEKNIPRNQTLIWELCLLGFLRHTKRSFKTEKYAVHKHTFRTNKNKNFSIKRFIFLSEEAKKKIEENRRKKDAAVHGEGV